MEINEEEYSLKLAKFLDEQGPNPGKTFFGSWGWYAMKKNEFERRMKEDGYVVKENIDRNT